MRLHHLLLLCLLAAGGLYCTEPTEPVFQLEQPFYLVEGQLADVAGRSSIRVRASRFRDVSLVFDDVTDAQVVAIAEAGTQVQWGPVAGEAGSYAPPADFRVLTGERWFVRVTFADGTVAESNPETVPRPTQLDGVNLAFDPEASFSTDRKRFLPGFRVLVDATDAGDVADYYQWDYRYWESSTVCATCYYGVYRNGECLPAVIPNGDRYDYLCLDIDSCYQVTPGGELNFASDLGFSGASTRDREIGNLEFDAYGGLLVEAIQYGLTEEAYNYGKVTSDLVNGGAGLNATIPSALTGNLTNVSGTDLIMLGFVSAVSVDTARTFVLRSELTGRPSTTADQRRVQLEPSVGPFSPPQAPCGGNGRSPLRPTGWPE